MMALLRWINFLFRWDGRIRRGQFVVYSFLFGLLSTILSMVLISSVLQPDADGGYPGDARFHMLRSLGEFLGWVVSAPLAARRLHDIGRSAVWVVPIYAYNMLVLFAFFTWPGIGNTWGMLVLILPNLIPAIWLFGTPGDPRENRYGPAPQGDPRSFW